MRNLAKRRPARLGQEEDVVELDREDENKSGQIC